MKELLCQNRTQRENRDTAEKDKEKCASESLVLLPFFCSKPAIVPTFHIVADVNKALALIDPAGGCQCPVGSTRTCRKPSALGFQPIDSSLSE